MGLGCGWWWAAIYMVHPSRAAVEKVLVMGGGSTVSRTMCWRSK